MRSVLRSTSFAAGLVCVFLVVGTAIIGPHLTQHDPHRQNLAHRLSPPNPTHLLGTDHLGRDILSRVVLGARVALLVGVSSVVVGALVGVTIGTIAGYAGGWIDAALSRLIDALMACPLLLTALFVVAFLGPGMGTTIIAISSACAPRFARLARGDVLTLRHREFVEATRAAGGSGARIILRHILPNMVGSLSVLTTLLLATAMLTEANLSFLGLGVQPPEPSWGSMISAGRQYVTTAYWYPVIPGVAILITVLGFNLVGDGIRDLLDPRLGGAR